MRPTFALVFVLVLVGSLSSSQASTQKRACPGPCTKIFQPLCVYLKDGIHTRTIENKCELRNFNCERGFEHNIAYQGECTI